MHCVFGAKGLISIINKPGSTLINPLLTLGHNLFFRLETLLMPDSSSKFQYNLSCFRFEEVFCQGIESVDLCIL